MALMFVALAAFEHRLSASHLRSDGRFGNRAARAGAGIRSDYRRRQEDELTADVFCRAGISISEVLVKTQAPDVLTKVIFNWPAPFVTNVFSLTMSLYWTAFVLQIFSGEELAMWWAFPSPCDAIYPGAPPRSVEHRNDLDICNRRQDLHFSGHCSHRGT
jgi:hypothetical protein